MYLHYDYMYVLIYDRQLLACIYIYIYIYIHTSICYSVCMHVYSCYLAAIYLISGQILLGLLHLHLGHVIHRDTLRFRHVQVMFVAVPGG